MRYEKASTACGSPFTWSEHESLADLSKPERIKQIKDDYEKRLEKLKKQRLSNPLRPENTEIDIDDLYGKSKMCLACGK